MRIQVAIRQFAALNRYPLPNESSKEALGDRLGKLDVADTHWRLPPVVISGLPESAALKQRQLPFPLDNCLTSNLAAGPSKKGKAMPRSKNARGCSVEVPTIPHFIAKQIEMLPLDSLRPYERNARTHSARQLKQIGRSIEEFGFTSPILIDGDKRILAGHGRAEAARQLGMREIPTVRLDHLSEAQTRAYILADNRLAEKAGWDDELLALELQGLIDIGFDVELTGFEQAEIEILIDGVNLDNTEVHEDPPPPYPTQRPVTTEGDLWLLGQHRLVCGDAREDAVYEQLLKGEKAQFTFTDPPYNVPIDGHVCGLGRVRHKEFAMGCGEMSPKAYTQFLSATFGRIAAHSSDGSIHDVCIDWRHIEEMMSAGRTVFSELKNLCIWNKTNAGMGSFYRSKHELVCIWKNGTAPHINNFQLGQFGRVRTNVWDYPGVNTFRAGRDEELAMHPTVKPTALIADAIKDCSKRDGLVLDPFAGSGSTLIACEITGRRGRAIELDPGYVDVAIRRWELRTRKIARLERTNETFEEVGTQRALTARCTGGDDAHG